MGPKQRAALEAINWVTWILLYLAAILAGLILFVEIVLPFFTADNPKFIGALTKLPESLGESSRLTIAAVYYGAIILTSIFFWHVSLWRVVVNPLEGSIFQRYKKMNWRIIDYAWYICGALSALVAVTQFQFRSVDDHRTQVAVSLYVGVPDGIRTLDKWCGSSDKFGSNGTSLHLHQKLMESCKNLNEIRATAARNGTGGEYFSGFLNELFTRKHKKGDAGIKSPLLPIVAMGKEEITYPVIYFLRNAVTAICQSFIPSKDAPRPLSNISTASYKDIKGWPKPTYEAFRQIESSCKELEGLAYLATLILKEPRPSEKFIERLNKNGLLFFNLFALIVGLRICRTSSELLDDMRSQNN